MLIDIRTLQRWMAKARLYAGTIDGTPGDGTMAGVVALLDQQGVDHAGWSKERLLIGASQVLLDLGGYKPGPIDGYVGPMTRAAWADRVDTERRTVSAPELSDHLPSLWPREADVPEFFGPMNANTVELELPYEMYLTWNPSKRIRSFAIHEKVAESAARAFAAIHLAYGPKKPDALLRWSGCLNPRKKRNGTTWSMHSWAIAIDFDDDHNQLHMPRPQARLSGPEFNAFWAAWEKEGWVSLGRERNFDWMHVQAARL